MTTIRIPGPLRSLSGGEAAVEVAAADLRGAIDQLDARFPGFKERLLDPDGKLRQFVNVYLNDEDVRFEGGLDTKLEAGDEVSIIPAVAGGRARA